MSAQTLSPGPSLIDLQQIQRWRRICTTTHGDHCNARYSELLSSQLDTLNLVDVNTDSLVTLPSSTSYVALSYVWGDVPLFKTTTSNIDLLRQPGSLSSKKTDVPIPDTIRDAMYLVKTLGERYLWVDCLSVVQDASREEMERTLRAMARIYTSAEFTIVDAGGTNANYGLRGIGGPSRERTPDDFPKPEDRDGFPWASKWGARGWTFQEGLFARRLLIFEGLASWICGRCEWLEEDDHSLKLDNVDTNSEEWPAERPHLGVPTGLMSLLPKIPSLGRWGMLVENYASRTLTHQSDTSAAFAGATEIMSATFPGGILHGLPEFFFDIALLWQPELSVYRRGEETPSWSWTGWRGGIDCLAPWYPFHAGIYRDVEHFSAWMTIAPLNTMATFYKTRVCDQKAVPISKEFYKYQALREDVNAVLPPGWTRHHDPNGDYFTTLIYPDFKYGFPLPEPDTLHESSSGTFSHILTCTAPRALLRFGQIYDHVSALATAALLTPSGQNVGSLTFHHYEIEGAVPTAQCELLALSEAEAPHIGRLLKELYLDDPLGWDVRGWENEMCSRNGEETWKQAGFVNVMWIGWERDREEDVAWRKGIGRVGKRAWDSLGAEMVTVKLG